MIKRGNTVRGMTKRSDASRDVAKQLRDVRKSQGMTQESLAELVGTKKSNISRLESGRYNPSLDFLAKVAGGLGKQIQVKVKYQATNRRRTGRDNEVGKLQG